MNRTLTALVLGAAIGVAATLYVRTGQRSGPPASAPRAAQTSFPRDSERNVQAGLAASAAGSVRERASLYSLAADADAARLEELLAETASRPAGAARDLAIDVYLRRYVEIDAQRAIETARAYGVAGERLAELHASWAAADPESALDALREITDAAEAHAAAAAILAALGNDDAALAQVVAAVPPEQATALRLTSVELRAAASPDAALDVALALRDPLRWPALERVAQIWARGDARAALERAEDVADERLRLTFQFAVLGEWLRLDADAALAQLAEMDATVRQQFLFSRELQQLAISDPQRALDAARRFPDETRGMLEQMALQALAAEDPHAALEYANAASSEERRRALLQLVAMGYGRNDPDAAIAWARANQPTAGFARMPGYNSLLHQVLVGIGMKDPNRAVDVALTLETDVERSLAVRWVIINAASVPGMRSENIAQHVLTIEDPQLRQTAFDSLFETWSMRAPREALDWAFANGAGLQIASLEPIAQRLGQTDPALAASYAARVPAEARELWVRGVAAGYAQTDATAALTWISQFRGEPAYDAGIAMITPAIARQEPRRAAELLGSITGNAQYDNAVASVASAWGATEPARAVEWALNLRAGRARDLALTQISQVWAFNDAASARNWVLQLPPGATRDAGLSGVVMSASVVDPPETALWNAFSDARARERAVVRALAPIAMRNADEARALMERYVRDPDARRQAEQMIEGGRNGARMGPMGVSQNIILEGC